MLRLAVLLAAVGLCLGGVVMDMSDEPIDSTEFGVSRGKVGTNCSCGWSNKDSKRVINGREALVNEYPFIAGLMTRAKIVICGATIITQRHAITATHCTIELKEHNRLPMYVIVGAHNINSYPPEGEIIAVKESYEHEKYLQLTHPNDIALLVLERDITFTKEVGPACLPKGLLNLDGKDVRVIGWGRTTPDGSTSDVPLKADLRIIPTAECNQKLPVRIPVDVPMKLCAYGKNRDSCKGDSGGPLVWLDPDTNRYTLIGVVSYGFKCNAGKPGIYANVGYYLDWIQEKIIQSQQEGLTCAKN